MPYDKKYRTRKIKKDVTQLVALKIELTPKTAWRLHSLSRYMGTTYESIIQSGVDAIFAVFARTPLFASWVQPESAGIEDVIARERETVRQQFDRRAYYKRESSREGKITKLSDEIEKLKRGE
jgi:hypothetical protein